MDLENSSFDKKEDSLEVLYSPNPYIKSRYKYDNPDGTFEYLYSSSYPVINSNMDFDSIVESEMKDAQFNHIGKYIQALYAIKDTDTLTKKYFHLKQNGGILPLKFFIRGTLSLIPDFNDYFHKRIVLLEVVY